MTTADGFKAITSALKRNSSGLVCPLIPMVDIGFSFKKLGVNHTPKLSY
jgi:hypothetical protein